MALKRRLESEDGVAERVEVGLDLVLVIGIERCSRAYLAKDLSDESRI